MTDVIEAGPGLVAVGADGSILGRQRRCLDITLTRPVSWVTGPRRESIVACLTNRQQRQCLSSAQNRHKPSEADRKTRAHRGSKGSMVEPETRNRRKQTATDRSHYFSLPS